MLFVQRSGWAMVSTGNPYKELVACLMKRGVQIELCGAMAAVHNWGNEDLLPEVKVNTNAIARMSQLMQEGVRSNHGWD
jgi:intracellular sulfur oxidation DsrE/DsrF family protein